MKPFFEKIKKINKPPVRVISEREGEREGDEVREKERYSNSETREEK